MISSVSSWGGAEVSAPALQHVEHKEFIYKQKPELGCLGGRTYVKVEDEVGDEPPCATPEPQRSKLEHGQKVGQVGHSRWFVRTYRTMYFFSSVPSERRNSA